MIKASELKIQLFEVEQILDKRIKHKVVEYFIKWKDYPLEQATWEPKRHLSNIPQTLANFQRKYRQKHKTTIKNQKLRLKNGKKIEEFLSQKPETIFSLDNVETINPKTRENQQKTNESDVVILNSTKNRNDKTFKICREGDIIDLSLKQILILYPAELSLFSEKRVREILKKRSE